MTVTGHGHLIPSRWAVVWWDDGARLVSRPPCDLAANGLKRQQWAACSAQIEHARAAEVGVVAHGLAAGLGF